MSEVYSLKIFECSFLSTLLSLGCKIYRHLGQVQNVLLLVQNKQREIVLLKKLTVRLFNTKVFPEKLALLNRYQK